MAPTNSTFFDTDYPELKKAISDIIESIAQYPQEEKGKLFEALSEQVIPILIIRRTNRRHCRVV